MEEELRLRQLREELNDEYNSDNFYGSNVASNYYKEYESIDYSTYSHLHKTVGLTFYKNRDAQIMLLTISLFFLFTFPFINTNKSIDFQIFLNVVYTVFIVSTIYCIYSIFFKEKKIVIETKEDFLVLNETQNIFWNEILTTGILRINSRPQTEFAILGLASGEIIKIRITGTDISANDLIKIIHINQGKKD